MLGVQRQRIRMVRGDRQLLALQRLQRDTAALLVVLRLARRGESRGEVKVRRSEVRRGEAKVQRSGAR